MTLGKTRLHFLTCDEQKQPLSGGSLRCDGVSEYWIPMAYHCCSQGVPKQPGLRPPQTRASSPLTCLSCAHPTCHLVAQASQQALLRGRAAALGVKGWEEFSSSLSCSGTHSPHSLLAPPLPRLGLQQEPGHRLPPQPRGAGRRLVQALSLCPGPCLLA